MIGLFAALHESAFGPKQVFRGCRRMSAFAGGADIDQPPTDQDL
jgi:hypothetical protein